MLSQSYPSKGIAKAAAKIYAQKNGLAHFVLIVDVETRQYYFSDEEQAPGPRMLIFAKMERKKNKWQDKPPFAKRHNTEKGRKSI